MPKQVIMQSDTFEGAWTKQNENNTELYTEQHNQNTDTNLGIINSKTPVDEDKVIHRNSENSDILVTSTWFPIKTFFKTYFDGIYANIIHHNSHTNGADDIQSATNLQKGLATPEHIIAIESNTSKLDEAATLEDNNFTGEQNLQDNVLKRPKFLDISETVNNLGVLTGGTTPIDLELGNVVIATISTAAQTFTFINPPATGSNGSFVLFLTNGGSRTVIWPTTIKWIKGTPPELTTLGEDSLVFTTNDGGNSWKGFAAGLDIS